MEMQWLEREPPSSALLLYVNCSSITNVLILIAVSLRSTTSDGLHAKLKTDIFPSRTLPLVLTFIAYSSIWQMRKVTAAHLFWLPVTSRLKGKALLVNYYAKWDHGKITTSSTEVNIFSFFRCTGRVCQLWGVWNTTNLFCTWVQLCIPHSSSLSLSLQVPCLYLHSSSYNVITCSEGKREQKLPDHFPTD